MSSPAFCGYGLSPKVVFLSGRIILEFGMLQQSVYAYRDYRWPASASWGLVLCLWLSIASLYILLKSNLISLLQSLSILIFKDHSKFLSTKQGTNTEHANWPLFWEKTWQMVPMPGDLWGSLREVWKTWHLCPICLCYSRKSKKSFKNLSEMASGKKKDGIGTIGHCDCSVVGRQNYNHPEIETVWLLRSLHHFWFQQCCPSQSLVNWKTLK